MTNTINNVPRELLENIVLCYNEGEFELGTLAAECHAILSAPSPAGVDGLETICVTQGGCNVSWTATKVLSPAGTALCRLSDAQAIIDGLRGEVEEERAKVAQLEEGVPRIMEASYQFRQQRDQQAQRIGELEGLLRKVRKGVHWAIMADRIDAALSAGKEGE